ncbi:unnamed protein product [Spirodela intermedia]|uniref:Non-lysosomal glucosylceramidase n=1 Tax=Spirodela intermedia TaxID=51605 RepID=A0A7I8ICF7_SPIIN|nr:unnamed protein product [Spirodela intermedia]CAA6655301.1 unnamed protein product [Spirodela intermedia]
MVSGQLFHFRKHSWPPDEYVTRATLQLLDFDGGAPPEQAWRRRLNSHANLLKEFSVTFMEAIRMIRLGVRLWSYVREEASHGRKAPIDPFTREKCRPSASHGVPLGGMGSGSISRGFRGEFKHWQIIPNSCEASPLMTNQFSIFINRDGGQKKFSSVLSPGHHEGLGKSQEDDISSWGWNLSGQHSTYHALFPRAWTVYDGEPDPELKISCRQISPFIPHNYRESSLPTSVFVYTLVNTGKERAKVSLLLTWANSIGGVSHLSGNHSNEPFRGEDGVAGVLLHHKQNGHFDQDNFSAGHSMPSSPGDTLCAAVSASTWVEPHGKCTVAFALAWASPKVKFKKGCTYNRRYTKFYGTSKNSAAALAHHALMSYKWWEEEIEKWQKPILSDERLPEWYKFTLFNELYFLVAGGTLWTGKRRLRLMNSWSFARPTAEGDDVGRFLYLEGTEYVMWCTYDVHFYASFALLDLFPKIELSIQRDFARAVLCEDRRRVKFLADGNSGMRKVRGAVPHDLGMHDPWHEMNAYNIHDTSRWKDLNPKFVLQVWPAVTAAMDYMDQFDRDGDGLIENDGFPDQTYDAWTVHGVSAYCGCLWLAALQAAVAMALRLGDHPFADKCRSKLLMAKPSFEEKVWNGSYFNYDSGSYGNSRSIQADQLAGQWYTAAAGLPPLFDEAKIRSTLQKIFDFNVMKVGGGRMGAVNGMTPSGKVDESCMQSREIWTGVTYGVAATMLHAGMHHQAFSTAEGIFTAGWSEEGFGYWFQTPEAWTVDGHYRSLIYMRPLAIWGMQWALTPSRAILEAPKTNMMDRIYTSPADLRAKNEASVRKIGGSRSTCCGHSVFHCEC